MTSEPFAAGAPQDVMGENPPLAAMAPHGALGMTLDLLERRSHAEQARLPEVLARALESSIIPRLALSHAEADPAGRKAASGEAPAEDDIAALVGFTRRGDLQAASAFVAALRAREMPLERILLDLLPAVARRLGAMWQEDRCDFTEVTVGLCCLQQVVLEQHDARAPRRGRPETERRVLLAPAPDEQHAFGLLVVGEFFRREGWEVCSATGASAREIVAMVRKQWFGLVGFTLSCEDRLGPLATLIHDLRRASRNPRLGVLVGGLAFLERPELVALVGADATAADGQQAVLKAETLLALLLQEP